jgi:hypothetical protein
MRDHGVAAVAFDPPTVVFPAVCAELNARLQPSATFLGEVVLLTEGKPQQPTILTVDKLQGHGKIGPKELRISLRVNRPGRCERGGAKVRTPETKHLATRYQNGAAELAGRLTCLLFEKMIEAALFCKT